MQNGPGNWNGIGTRHGFVFLIVLCLAWWKLMFRTDIEGDNDQWPQQIKPGQFYTAIHLTIWAVQNSSGMLNRNKTGLVLIFWTGLDQVRWKLVFRTHFEKHTLRHHTCSYIYLYRKHDDVIKWKHFPRYWPFVRIIYRSSVNSPHKSQWHGALMFSLICVWINGSVKNREAGDLRRYRAHYDVNLMM